jgi:5'-methylthioadenosine phosphorylase/5'-methylthioinosine phosphorylase
MAKLAIIGGTGLSDIDDLQCIETQHIETPFGQPSAALIAGEIHGNSVIFLPRHGVQHTIAPHSINYRANIWALQALGVTDIIAVAAVGGIGADLGPGSLVCPDQIIDYTYDREHSFFSDDFSAQQHIDFTYPYNEKLRQKVMTAGRELNFKMSDGGVYGATQGPRLETAAEITRMAQDGCSIVGMTGMPEAALARELGIDYACCALVVNWAAGLSDSLITMTAIEQTLSSGMADVKLLLRHIIGQSPQS